VPQSLLVVDKKDNVATALRQLEKGSTIQVEVGEGAIEITGLETIPVGHKLALKDIEAGEPVIKYGEVVGLATKKIKKGEYIHVHNVEGLKGRGDKQ